MFLNNLNLTNFRNFSHLDLKFSPLTLLIGKNAQGKSNLLEAVYFLATTKSLRAEADLQLIKQQETYCLVEGEIKDDDNLTKLEIGMQIKDLDNLEKRVKVNGIARRSVDYLGNLVVVHFCPEDINLVAGPPALRRWHLDLTLAQIDRVYKKAITTYTVTVTSRNRILKRIREGLAKMPELDFWTNQLLVEGNILTAKRKEFFDSINQFLREKTLSKPGQFKLIYQENILSKERLEHYLPREIASATSLIGPHRDDFHFMMENGHLENRNLRHFGSRGEQRTAVLELKLAELFFVHQNKKTRPILILDDVFSELDREHQEFVFSIVNKQQTILSAVAGSQIPDQLLKQAQVLNINGGKVV